MAMKQTVNNNAFELRPRAYAPEPPNAPMNNSEPAKNAAKSGPIANLGKHAYSGSGKPCPTCGRPM